MEIALLGLVVVAAAYAYWTGRRAARAVEDAARARLQTAAMLRRLQLAERALRRQVATLNATRDMALVANDDVSIEPILTALAQIVERLLESRAAAFHLAGDALPPRPDGAPALAVHGPVSEATDDAAAALAREAVEQCAIVRGERAPCANGAPGASDVLRLAAPLPSDQTIVGAVVVALPAETEESLVRESERTLVAIAKHLALAITKPTLYDRAVTCGLTGLFTKRHLTQELERLLAQSRRTKEPAALVICDIDHFKAVNDHHGHLAGDVVLVAVAQRIREGIRAYDTAFRFGGEELCVIAPRTSLDEAARLAERLRVAIASAPVPIPEGGALAVTASFGVAAFGPGCESPADLLHAADRALYRAKAHGRNRVERDEVDAPTAAPLSPAAELAGPAASAAQAAAPAARAALDPRSSAAGGAGRERSARPRTSA